MGEFYKPINNPIRRKTCDLGLDFHKKEHCRGSLRYEGEQSYLHARPGAVNSGRRRGIYERAPQSFPKSAGPRKAKDVRMMGGAGIIGSFLNEGGMDEFIVHLIPTLIGEGIPLIVPARRNVL
jgi:RibD C-terminal domain